ncbi:MAG TPA: hypothetical protein VNE39_29545 [Planctomycetota bacterium]|nr:hypothetical protein [Planctomycetota bacterium]
MGEQVPRQVRQDLVDAEYGSGHAGMGPSSGQIAFDLLFGVVAPIVLLLADPALFVADVADRAALPPYLARPTYVAIGGLVLALVVWGITGLRVPVLGMLLAGPFAAGAAVSAALGLALLWFALGHSDLLSGWLAFTPWFTAFVFLRHCALACRAGARRSVGLTVLATTLTSVGIVVTLYTIGVGRERRARLLESQLLSDSAGDFEYACAQIQHAWQVDMDRVAESYAALKEDDPRRQRLAGAHLRITGVPIETAVERLFPRYAASVADKAAPAKEDPNARWVNLLFSTDHDEHQTAADELVTLDPDPKMLEAIVLRYAQLPEGDARRAWIRSAYTGLNSDGETIEAALKRLGSKAAPSRKGRPPAKATEAPDAPPPPPRPAPKTAHETP